MSLSGGKSRHHTLIHRCSGTPKTAYIFSTSSSLSVNWYWKLQYRMCFVKPPAVLHLLEQNLHLCAYFVSVFFREFVKWKKETPLSDTLGATDFSFVLRHYSKCQRSIRKNCPSFSSNKTYARAMVTTYFIGKKAYWKPREDVGWKRVRLKPPPKTKNEAPVRIFYNHNRKSLATRS